MAKRRYRRRQRRSPQDGFGNLLEQLLGMVAALLVALYFLNRSYFWSLAEHWVFPALVVVVIATGATALTLRAQSRRRSARFSELLNQIKQKQLERDVQNFIDGFGSEADDDDTWTSDDHSHTFQKVQLTRFRDHLIRQGVALSAQTDEDITSVLEHFIDMSEERFLTERVTSRVQHSFSELNKTGDDFERLVVRLYEGMGYAAKRIGGVGDQGGDVIASKGGENVLIQAKFYGGSVGNAAVQQAAAARQHYNCSKAAVVTTSTFTMEAQALARSNSVDLIDGGYLTQLLAEYLHEAWK